MHLLTRRAILVLPVVIVIGCAPAPVHRSPNDAPTITSADLQDPNEPIERVLEKKVPGLVARRAAGGGLILQIRGASSYEGSPTSPLYILNGSPVHAGVDGSIDGLNPNEIETVKVLKGADAGIYGIEGGNGVIVITTRRPGPRN